jgi:hypothetical protein
VKEMKEGFGIDPTEREVCGLLEVGNFLGNK